jgi:hypothetical protein
MAPKDSEPSAAPRDVGFLFIYVVVIVVAFFGIAAMIQYMAAAAPVVFTPETSAHFPVILGVPFAALVASALVSFFRIADGPFQIEFLGLRLESGSAAITLWIAAFLAIVAGVRLLGNVSHASVQLRRVPRNARHALPLWRFRTEPPQGLCKFTGL